MSESDKVSAASQSVLKQITKAGQLVGLGATGWIVDRIGYKWTMLGALVGIVPIVFMQFFAPNKEVLIAAQFLIGIPLAPFLTLSNVSPYLSAKKDVLIIRYTLLKSALWRFSLT